MATRLTGEAARRWLAENPNAAYIDNRTGQTVARKQSGIEKFALGISQPFRAGVGVAQELGATIGDLSKMAKGDYKNVGKRQKKYALMSEEETKALQEDPLKIGLKSGAGVASFGLGGGAGTGATVGKRILSGAAKSVPSGLLGGFGYSKSGEELKGALTGGALAGVIGGAAQGLREIAKVKIPQKGKTTLTTKEFLGQEPGMVDRMGSVQEAKKAASTFEQLAKEYKLPMTTKTQRAESLATMKELLKQQMDDIASASSGVTDSAKIQSLLNKNKDLSVMIKTASGAQKDVANEAMTKLFSTADESGRITTKGLNETIQYMDDMAGGYSKMDKSSSDAIRFLRKMREVLRGELSVMEPKLSVPKAQYGLLADATSPVQRLAASAKRGLRVIGTELPLTGEAVGPVFDAVTRGTNQIAAGASQIPGIALGGLSAIGQRIPQNMPVGGIANVLGQLGERQPQEQLSTQGMTESPIQGLGQTQQPSYSIYDALVEASQIMPGASESEIMGLAKMLMEQNAPEMSKEQVAMQGALNIVDEIGNMVNDLDLSASQLGAAVGGLGRKAYGALIPSSKAGIYNTTRAGFVSRISRALGEVGVLTDKDIQRAVDLIPDLTDTPASASEKLVRLRSMMGGMQQLYGGNTQQLSDQYNTWQQ